MEAKAKKIKEEEEAKDVDVDTLLFVVNDSPFIVPDEGIFHVECTCTPSKILKTNHISNTGVKGLLALVFG